MVKIILFDFWGTVMENGVWSPIKQVKNILQIPLPFSDYVQRMEKSFMTKPFPTLRESFQELCREFALSCTDAQIDQLIGVWNKNWMLARPFLDVQTALEHLKEKYTLILVSNTDCFSVGKSLEKHPELQALFHQHFFSHELGLLKTDSAFFEHVLKNLQVSKEDCILVGDSIESDMLAAKQAGIRGVLIDRSRTRDWPAKISSLQELEPFLEREESL